jgi:transposase
MRQQGISDFKIQPLNHFGLIAGLIDKLKIVEKIDTRLPIPKYKNANLTHGQRVKAMIINGLGFTQSPIYMTPNFFEEKPVEALFGEGVKADYFNDDALGRTLDEAFKYGLTALFAEIANEVSHEFMPQKRVQYLHLDTTSLKLTGEYNVQGKYLEGDVVPPLPKYGHSKDHRPDLKQIMMSLSVTGPANLPVWFEGLDGNSQDKSNFHDTLARINTFREALDDAADLVVVADSALYVKNKLNDAIYKWITRVPESIKVAKSLVCSDAADFSWQALSEGYQGVWLGQIDRGMRQNWALVYSDQANIRETKTFDKRVEKVTIELKKEAAKIGRKEFSSIDDAQKEACHFAKQLKYHNQTEKIEAVTKFSTRGRPKINDKPVISHYRLTLTLVENAEKQVPYRNKLGRFILATNELDSSAMNAEAILTIYKEQQGVERGFRFIKDPQFHLNSVFLEKPERINALMMIMTLSLLVYNAGEYQIRETLKKQNATILNQVGKPTAKPTMRWIIQRLDSIQYVEIKGQGSVVSSISEEKEKIIRLFGTEVSRVYQLE